MKISVFGLGYVGSVSAASFAASGHEVVGVDANADKVSAINAGRSPVVEPGLEELIAHEVARGALRATTGAMEAIHTTEVSLICVGTPSQKNGSLNLEYLERVTEQIGEALRTSNDYHVVVVRSTVLPGTTHDLVIPAIERTSGRKYGVDFGVAVNPEFLREGTAIHDFQKPPLTLIGHNHAADAHRATELYPPTGAPLVSTSIRVAEMLKYTSNCWHALKVSFANEIGNICRRVGVDSHELMDIFCRDDKLNISPAYLKPGFAFGGSCLPKDLRALGFRARELDLETPVLSSILPSNRLQIELAINEILDTGHKRIGLLGFSFKEGTDDLRESPMVTLAETLLGKGLTLRIYDRHVALARLVGANKDYIERQIAHLSSLMASSIDQVLDECEVIVIGTRSDEFADALMRIRPEQIVIDLVRLPLYGSAPANYRGLCW